MYMCRNPSLKPRSHFNLVFYLEMPVVFFSIAVTDLCTKMFEKGGVVQTIEVLSKANMEAPLSCFSVLFGGRLELTDHGPSPRQCVLK